MRRLLTIGILLTTAPVAVAQEVDERSDSDRAEVAETESTDAAEALAARAEEAYVAGNFAEAIELLRLAYVESENPNMLYNIARVHEDAGNLVEALSFYRQFVVAPGVDIDYRREALASTEALEQQLAAREPVHDEQQPEPPAPLEPVIVEQSTRVIYQSDTGPRRTLNTIGWVVTAIGAATVVTGAGFGTAALVHKNQFDSAPDLETRRRQGRIMRELAAIADPLYITGSVLIVTGLVTAYASRRRAAAKQEGLTFSFSHDGIGALWTRSF